MPIHRDLDGLRETAAGSGKIGTTWRGIGPAYEDKVGRRAIRVCDLAHLDALDAQLDRLCAHHDALRAGFGEPPVDRERLIADLKEIAPFVLEYARAGLEAAEQGPQGWCADIVRRRAGCAARRRSWYLSVRDQLEYRVRHGRFGFGPWPERSWASCSASSRPTPPASASGPFPTELEDETGQRLGERGHEFGTVTGRKRRCGWFDAVIVRQSCAVSGVTGIALTKLDVLDGFETIKICTGYRSERQESTTIFRRTAADQAAVEPIYEEMPGWQETTAGARSWADLPAQAIKYISRVQELIETPVALVSTSPAARGHDLGARSLCRLTALHFGRSAASSHARRRRRG